MSKTYNRGGKGQKALPVSFYWQYFGLERDPFSALPDDGNFYLSFPHLEDKVDLLSHFIRTQNTLLAVVGNEGVGKSSFARHFVSQVEKSFRVHYFKADSLFSTRKLVRELERGFGVKAPVNESPEEQLDAEIAEIQYNSQTCLLIIDDAHFLPLETLNSLLFLLRQQSEHQMRLHILLFGDKNLQDKLNNLAMQYQSNEYIHSMVLDPLDLEQTEKYLQYRMQRAGLNGPLPFGQMQIEQIYASAKGIPDQINRTAQQWLLDDLTKRKAKSKGTVVKKYQSKAVGVALVAATLVVTAVVLSRISETTQWLEKSTVALNAKDAKVAMQSEVYPVPTDFSRVATLAGVESNPALNGAAAPQKFAFAPAKASLPVISDLIQQWASNAKAAPEANAAEPIRLARANPDEALSNAAPARADVVGNASSEKIARETAPAKSERSREDLSPPSKSSFVKKGSVSFKTLAPLMKANPSHFTLQLIGLSDKAAMARFIDKNQLTGKAHYFESKLNGKPWYILVYGNYDSMQAALDARKALPDSLQKYTPFVRNFGKIQQEIKKHNG